MCLLLILPSLYLLCIYSSLLLFISLAFCDFQHTSPVPVIVDLFLSILFVCLFFGVIVNGIVSLTSVLARLFLGYRNVVDFVF